MTLAEALYYRLADEGISLYGMSTDDMKKVNEIIAELIHKHKEDE